MRIRINLTIKGSIMTYGGWIMLILSIGSVTSLFVWCIYQVLTIPRETEHVHGFEPETPDMED
jgi:hypothetical protein